MVVFILSKTEDFVRKQFGKLYEDGYDVEGTYVNCLGREVVPLFYLG